MPKYYWILLLIVCSACDHNRIFEGFVTLPTYWHQDDAVSFEFVIDDESLTYDLVAQIKQDIDYPNYNFYFKYSLVDPADSVLTERLEEAIFFEPKTGRPLGSGIGDTFDHEYVLEEAFQFPAAGDYKVDLRQFMRVDSIPNILRLGLRIERSTDD
ncbi:MAG: gliding motility lipoprotein GldH [Bacteroidota bacterium]